MSSARKTIIDFQFSCANDFKNNECIICKKDDEKENEQTVDFFAIDKTGKILRKVELEKD